MKRWIPAPITSSHLHTGSVTGIWLEENERVQWVWSFFPDGCRIVSGYDILPLCPCNKTLRAVMVQRKKPPPH